MIDTTLIPDPNCPPRDPHPEDWTAELEVVTLTQHGFDCLFEYSTTLPTGKTIGKRWKRYLFAGPAKGTWVMGEYVEDPDPSMVGISWSRIEVAR